MRPFTTLIAVAAPFALIATPLMAQNAATGTAMNDPTMTAPVTSEDDDDFPWGLLGLIGLAGLLGRKRDDNRRDTSPRI